MQPVSGFTQAMPSLGLAAVLCTATSTVWDSYPEGTFSVHPIHWPVLLPVPVSTSEGRACLSNIFAPPGWIFIVIKEKQGSQSVS